MIFSRASRGNQPCQHFDFRLLFTELEKTSCWLKPLALSLGTFHLPLFLFILFPSLLIGTGQTLLSTLGVPVSNLCVRTVSDISQLTF